MSLIGQSAGLLFKIDADSSGVKRELAAVDSSIGSLGGKMSTFSGAATVAAAGIAAIGAAALTAGKFLFDLTATSAEYGSKIFDASEKTGLATETLSAMGFAADQSGTSLESVTAATAKFSKAVATAGEDAKKSAQFLKDFGVSPTEALNDLDGALGKVFTRIVNAREGVEQMSLAQKAFGKSGAELLPFIKSFDGDLTALTKKAKDLGITLSKEDAKAADDFGDTLDTLKAQAAGVGRTFTGPLMRDITASMATISGSLSSNQAAVKAWGEEVAKTLRGLKNISAEIYSFAQTPAGRALSVLLFGTFIGTNNVVGQFAGPPPPQGGAPIDNLIPGYDPLKQKQGPLSYDQPDPEAAKRAADERARIREADFQKKLAAQSKHNALMLAGARADFAAEQAELERQFLEKEITEAEYRDRATRALNEYQDKISGLLTAGYNLDAAGKSGQELDNLYEQVTQAITALNREVATERRDLETTITEARTTEAEKQKKTAEQSAEDQLRIERARNATTLSELESMLRRKLLSESEFITAKLSLQLKELDSQIALAKTEADRIELQEQRKQLILANQAEFAAASQAEREAADAVTEAIRRQNLEWENLFALVANEEASPFQTIIDGWNAVVEAMAESAPGMTDVIDLMANAFSGMANAIGNVVQQYVMYGKTAPGIMRQVLAQALAAIAAEAAMRAVYALAMGFFFLATHQYVDATNAFISAAIFGSIAVGAALLGRAIAPKQEAQSSFNSQASTSTSSGGNPGQGSAGKAGVYSSQEDMTVDRSRNSPMGRIAVELMVKGKDAFADMFAFEISKNGKLRAAIQDAAAA